MIFIRLLLAGAATMVLCSGCMVSHQEVQHFRSEQTPPNYFRLSIESHGYFTRAKYSSGFYDEKALDLFLNEFGHKDYSKSGNQSSETQPNTTDSSGQGDSLTPGGDGFQIKSLTSKGVYAFIFSTNADEIASTIGAFAENQVAADYISALVNQERILTLKEKEKELSQNVKSLPAVKTELEGLVSQIPEQPAGSGTPDLTSYVYLLNAITRALNLPANFQTLDDAKPFFDALSTGL